MNVDVYKINFKVMNEICGGKFRLVVYKYVNGDGKVGGDVESGSWWVFVFIIFLVINKKF